MTFNEFTKLNYEKGLIPGNDDIHFFRGTKRQEILVVRFKPAPGEYAVFINGDEGWELADAKLGFAIEAYCRMLLA